jgi:teichuronic acid biosynthesis glycosyltransferase TuaG
MISVIIPCFNVEDFIKETLDSIVVQDEEISEIIVIDDGSTDGSASIIKSYSDARIIYLHQSNKGVSFARNRGLKESKGEFVVFFDADDKMSHQFLKSRKKALDNNRDADFCCGPVRAFPVEEKTIYGIAENVAEKLLTYDALYSSCPSNYLIRRSVLINHRILFNENLSSTADRYFLIQLANKSRGILIDEAPLKYRVNANSMSKKLSKKLFEDNEQYLIELRKNNLIPSQIEKDFLFRIQYILGLGFVRTGSYFKGLKYAMTAFLQNPKNFINQII